MRKIVSLFLLCFLRSVYLAASSEVLALNCQATKEAVTVLIADGTLALGAAVCGERALGLAESAVEAAVYWKLMFPTAEETFVFYASDEGRMLREKDASVYVGCKRMIVPAAFLIFATAEDAIKEAHKNNINASIAKFMEAIRGDDWLRKRLTRWLVSAHLLAIALRLADDFTGAGYILGMTDLKVQIERSRQLEVLPDVKARILSAVGEIEASYGLTFSEVDHGLAFDTLVKDAKEKALNLLLK